jgi:hypothetical protein
VCARQPFAEQELREGRAVALEQRLHVAGGDAVARRKCGQGQVLLAERCADVAFDRVEASRAQPAGAGHFGDIGCGAERKRNEVVDMGDGNAAELRA